MLIALWAIFNVIVLVKSIFCKYKSEQCTVWNIIWYLVVKNLAHIVYAYLKFCKVCGIVYSV